MCQPGNLLTCREVCECEKVKIMSESACDGGQIPLETEREGGEVKGVACWYYVCVVFVVARTFCV